MNSYESFYSHASAAPAPPFVDPTLREAPPPGACVLEPIVEVGERRLVSFGRGPHGGQHCREGDVLVCLCAALYVQERVERVYRECVEDHFVEVPDVTYVEKIVEVPQEQIQEKIVQVIKPIKKELIRYVPKDMFVDQVMEYEEVKSLRMQYVDKVVEVPRYNVREKIVEVPKVMVVERIIPVLKTYNHTRTSTALQGGATPARRQQPPTKPSPLSTPSSQKPLRQGAVLRRSEETPAPVEEKAPTAAFQVPSLHASTSLPAPKRSASLRQTQREALYRAATLPAELSPLPSISREGLLRSNPTADSSNGRTRLLPFETEAPRVVNAMSSLR